MRLVRCNKNPLKMESRRNDGAFTGGNAGGKLMAVLKPVGSDARSGSREHRANHFSASCMALLAAGREQARDLTISFLRSRHPELDVTPRHNSGEIIVFGSPPIVTEPRSI